MAISLVDPARQRGVRTFALAGVHRGSGKSLSAAGIDYIFELSYIRKYENKISKAMLAAADEASDLLKALATGTA